MPKAAGGMPRATCWRFLVRDRFFFGFVFFSVRISEGMARAASEPGAGALDGRLRTRWHRPWLGTFSYSGLRRFRGLGFRVYLC